MVRKGSEETRLTILKSLIANATLEYLIELGKYEYHGKAWAPEGAKLPPFNFNSILHQ